MAQINVLEKESVVNGKTVNTRVDVVVNPDTPLLLKSEMDGLILEIIFVDGRKYKLQHPGNRIAMRWQEECFNLTKGKISQEKLIDKCFEHCVFPIEHNFKPTLDNIKPIERGVWVSMLTRFLDGNLESSFS